MRREGFVGCPGLRIRSRVCLEPDELSHPAFRSLNVRPWCREVEMAPINPHIIAFLLKHRLLNCPDTENSKTSNSGFDCLYFLVSIIDSDLRHRVKIRGYFLLFRISCLRL